MADVDAKTVMALRKQTGAPMMQCKAALAESGGDPDKAVEILRKKGIKAAEGKAGREATEGLVFSYIHPPGKIGVMVEVACETDFVARNEDFLQFGKDLCLHIAFAAPLGIAREDVDPAAVEKEHNLLVDEARENMAGKPDEVIEKAVEGRMAKWFAERCLLEQGWVKEEKQTVQEVLNGLTNKIGEKLQVRRFVRYELGG